MGNIFILCKFKWRCNNSWCWRWYTTGLKNPDKLKRNFWNTIHNTKKVSINLLTDKNVETYELNGSFGGARPKITAFVLDNKDNLWWK